jgi:hypothetical protein
MSSRSCRTPNGYSLSPNLNLLKTLLLLNLYTKSINKSKELLLKLKHNYQNILKKN